MLEYVFDIWVNWVDGAIKHYQIPQFYEWSNKDKVQFMERMPLFKVKEGFFNYVLDGIFELPDDLIVTVKNQAFYREIDRVHFSNAFIICDGKRVLAVDPCDSNTPNKKSYLFPRQEQLVLDILADKEPTKFEYFVNDIPENDYLNLPDRFMYGLTRMERDLKSLLIEGLLLSLGSGDLAKVRYWYSEWDNKSMHLIKDLNVNELVFRLVEEVSIGFHQGHRDLLVAIAKSDPVIKIQYDKIVERDEQNGRKKKLG